jgi:hypothetical protein
MLVKPSSPMGSGFLVQNEQPLHFGKPGIGVMRTLAAARLGVDRVIFGIFWIEWPNISVGACLKGRKKNVSVGVRACRKPSRGFGHGKVVVCHVCVWAWVGGVGEDLISFCFRTSYDFSGPFWEKKNENFRRGDYGACTVRAVSGTCVVVRSCM